MHIKKGGVVCRWQQGRQSNSTSSSGICLLFLSLGHQICQLRNEEMQATEMVKQRKENLVNSTQGKESSWGRSYDKNWIQEGKQYPTCLAARLT